MVFLYIHIEYKLSGVERMLAKAIDIGNLFLLLDWGCCALHFKGLLMAYSLVASWLVERLTFSWLMYSPRHLIRSPSPNQMNSPYYRQIR